MSLGLISLLAKALLKESCHDLGTDFKDHIYLLYFKNCLAVMIQGDLDLFLVEVPLNHHCQTVLEVKQVDMIFEIRAQIVTTLLQKLSGSDDSGGPRLILSCEEPELYQHPPQA